VCGTGIGRSQRQKPTNQSEIQAAIGLADSVSTSFDHLILNSLIIKKYLIGFSVEQAVADPQGKNPQTKARLCLAQHTETLW